MPAVEIGRRNPFKIGQDGGRVALDLSQLQSADHRHRGNVFGLRQFVAIDLGELFGEGTGRLLLASLPFASGGRDGREGGSVE